MARDTRRAYEAELAKLTPKVRRAFIDAVADITSNAQLAAIEEAVAAGDWQAVIDLFRMDRRVFDRLDREIGNAFYRGGVYQLAHLGKKTLPSGRGGSLTVRFDGRNPRAEAWVRDRSSNLIREIVADQRAMIRAALDTELAAGQNPRKTALSLVGRINRATGKREGGLIGLHSQQAEWVRSLRAELADPETASAYLSRRARDRRFDRTVAKAIRDGKPVAQADIDRIARRYSDRLLKLRGDTIARTETIAALNAGRNEGIEQLIEDGHIARENVTVTWSATMDARTRDLHQSLNGATVVQGQAFVSDTGAQLRFPGDTSLGASGEDVINCRCYAAPRIDYLAMAV